MCDVLNWKNRRHRILLVSLSFLFAGGISACGNSGSSPTNAVTLPGTVDPADPGANPIAAPQVISGWLTEYSQHIEATVSRNYPDLLGVTDSRMKTVCPLWSGLDRGGREKFWSSLLWAIAGPESARNRTSVYVETTMSTDPVTGQQVRSEGLLQLSYQDVPAYHYTEGDISWENDRSMALADYVNKVKSGNPARTILNAYANLNLGLFIMNRLVTVHPSDLLETALGRYWSTMRATGSSFKTVLSGLKSRFPDCF